MLTDIQLNPTCSFKEFKSDVDSFQLRAWGKPREKRGTVLAVHGLCADSAWFEAGARELARQGFLVVAYDQRGFGSRPNAPFNSYEQWLDDLCLVARHLRDTECHGPVYLLGNSMGALVAVTAARRLEINGLILLSPGFEGNPRIFTFLYKARSVLSAFFSPHRPVNLPYSLDMVTGDFNVRNWLSQEAQAELSVPGVMLIELLKLSQKVLPALAALNLPVLMITAGQEKVVNNELSKKLFEKLPAPQKKYVCFSGAFHDLMLDPHIDEVADEIALWQSTLAPGLEEVHGAGNNAAPFAD